MPRKRRRRAKRKPELSATQILAWADFFYQRTGRWPHAKLGVIPASLGENWGNVDMALRDGYRGLPGGTTLARLLLEHRGKRNLMDLPRLTIKQILAWADAYYRRTGRWPILASGPIPEAPGETWLAVNQALYLGCRGFPGGSSLPQLLAEKRGKRHLSYLPRLTLKHILALADGYFRKHGEWPKRNSGPVKDAAGGTWLGIETALAQGCRGLPGGSSLARLLAAKRGVRNQSDLPHLGKKKILAWAEAHFQRTGFWPKVPSGPVHDAPGETWRAINAALVYGLRGLPAGSSLPQLLAAKHGVRNLGNLPRLSKKKILAWAEAHFQRTGSWPRIPSGPVHDKSGETWAAINAALRYGYRGLPGGISLFQLLTEARSRVAMRIRRRHTRLRCAT